MFVESCIFDVRSRAFMQIMGSMIENTFLSLAWLSSCLVQTTWGSKDNNPFKIEFDSKFIWP